MISHIPFFAAAAACCGAIYYTENNMRTGYFSVFIFLAIAGFFELATSNRWAAIALSGSIIASIFILSKLKYKYTRFALVYNDAFGFDRKVYRDIFRTYGRDAALAVAFFIISVSLFATLLFFVENSENHPTVVFSSLAISTIAAWALVPYAMNEYRRANWDGRHISTFFATMLSQRFRPADMTRLTISAPPSTANIARPARQIDEAPHIILIGGESTFAPRLFDLPEEPDVTQFFDGKEGLRDLKVEIFGGQTILSHTSCLTGLSTLLFGENRAYAPRFWRDRIGVSLPFFLKSHGYSVTALLSGQRDWMGIGGLYETIGVERVFEASDYMTAQDVDAMYARDSSVYNAALADIRPRIEQGGKRTCTIIETMRNHGPHSKTLTKESREVSSRKWFADTCKSLNGSLLRQAAEWYGRLRASVDDYNAFKAHLAANHPNETFLIVHYGDHQPTFCADIQGVSPEDFFKTYLTVDWIGQPLPTSTSYVGTRLPIFFVDLLVAQTAGLPLDGFLEAKAGLICENLDFASHDSPGYQGLIASLLQAGKLKPNSASIQGVETRLRT